MFGFDKISLAFSSNPIFFIIALIILLAYAVYFYRFTIPQISPAKKTLLVSLRSLAILLLLFFFFEPVLTLAKKFTIMPKSLVFVDNSRSIKIEDGTNRQKSEEGFLNKLRSNSISENTRLFSFGSKINSVSLDSLSKFDFSEGSSNFSNIFSGANKVNEEISSITIVSDGAITEGANPVFTAEKMNIPVYTVGVGDSSKKIDVEIKNVIYNEFIYAEIPTTVLANIVNTGYANQRVTVSLFENDVMQDQKNIVLSPDGLQNVNLGYTPKSGGEKKLTIIVSNLKGEFTYANNKKVFYVNVLSNKIKVLVLSGSPSPDLAFIKNALSSDDNLKINSITQTGNNKFLEDNNRNNLIDSTDVIFLVGFPSQITSNELLNKIKYSISNKSTPVFITLSNGTNFGKLEFLQSDFPFTVKLSSNNFYEVQPIVQSGQTQNPILQNGTPDPAAAWNNLPPVLQPDAILNTKPESNVLAKVLINNTPVNRPLILTRKLGTKRSIAVLAKNIWRWKLQTAAKDSDLFDRFILNSVKWLNNKEEQKRVNLRTSKKVYSAGETVEFSAQVYDEAFNPVSNAEVNVKIKSGDESYNVAMNSLGNGLYEGKLESNKTGDYTFTGIALQNGKRLGNDSGNFNIGEVDIESVNPRMNYEFLKSLATQTGGEYFDAGNYDELFNILKNLEQSSAKEKTETNELNLWSNEWLMAVVILLFGLEWFFRKRFGML